MTRRSLGGLAIAALFAACSSFGSDDGGTPVPADGGADACADLANDSNNCGACGHACGTAKTCVSGSCVPGCQGKIVYVSHDSGSDANDGCTPATPMKTIGAAVAFVSTQNLAAHEIHVCRGTYAEHALVLDHAASLRGGYNCLSWTRADKFGFDTQFSDPNETILQNADYASISTLDVAGGAVGPGVVIEDFTIIGAASGGKSSDALLVRDGAAPVLTDLKLEGGATSTVAGIGATALQIRNGATPEVKRFHVETGASSSPALGAAAVLVTTAGVRLHDGAVVGGASVGGGNGWVGIYAAQSTTNLPVTIANVDVSWNGPTVTTAGGVGAVGIFVEGGLIAIKGNHVTGGRANCMPAQCSSFGIQIADAVNPEIVGNVVYAGDPVAMNGSVSTTPVGIQAQRTTNALIADNAVHAGGYVGAATISAVFGLDFVFGSSPTIAGNTVVATGGVMGANSSYRAGMRLSGQANQTDGAQMAHVVGNLFVANLDPHDHGIQVDKCTGATIAELHDNAFVSTTFEGRVADTANCAIVNDYPTVEDPAVGGMNNVTVAPACAGAMPAASCAPIACANANDCASKIIQSWDAATLGYANVVTPTGYRLLPGITCLIAERAYALPSGVTTDLYGAARTTPYSVGAAELDGACTP